MSFEYVCVTCCVGGLFSTCLNQIHYSKEVIQPSDGFNLIHEEHCVCISGVIVRDKCIISAVICTVSSYTTTYLPHPSSPFSPPPSLPLFSLPLLPISSPSPPSSLPHPHTTVQEHGGGRPSSSYLGEGHLPQCTTAAH